MESKDLPIEVTDEPVLRKRRPCRLRILLGFGGF
jgi:hypothetical protein